MEAKKNPKYDLSLKIGMFRNLGLTVSLLLVILAFELPGSGNNGIIELADLKDDFEEFLEIPPTEQPPPPKPVTQIGEIKEIPDEVEIEEEIEVELDIEVTELTIVEDVAFSMSEEIEEEVADEIFIIVEEQPEFPGGIQAFYEFVGSKLKYPSQARRMGIQGKVYLQFVVDRDGSVNNIEVVKGVGAGCDEEAIRVLEMVPNFKPGKQRGKAVKVRMVIPIHFILADQS